MYGEHLKKNVLHLSTYIWRSFNKNGSLFKHLYMAIIFKIGYVFKHMDIKHVVALLHV